MVKKTKELHSLRRAGLGNASLQLSRRIFMFDAETWEEEKKIFGQDSGQNYRRRNCGGRIGVNEPSFRD